MDGNLVSKLAMRRIKRERERERGRKWKKVRELEGRERERGIENERNNRAR
jgi:hypothetical protein